MNRPDWLFSGRKERVILVTHNADGTDTVSFASGREFIVKPQYSIRVCDWVRCDG